MTQGKESNSEKYNHKYKNPLLPEMQLAIQCQGIQSDIAPTRFCKVQGKEE
jgi:hypothetical protein